MRGLKFLFLIGFLGACSKSSQPAQVHIQLPSLSKSFQALSVIDEAIDPDSGPWLGSIYSATQLNCYVVFVGGSSERMSRNSCQDKNSDSTAFQFGHFIGAIPAGGEMALELPADSSRRLILVGMNAKDGACNDFKANGVTAGKLSHPRILFDDTQVFTAGDHELKVEIAEDLTASKELGKCVVDEILETTPAPARERLLTLNLWELASLSSPSPKMGLAVSSSLNTFVTGAPNENSGDGAALVYQWDGESWVGEALPLPAALASANGGFGFSVSTDGADLIVGAPNANGGNGAAYIYSFDPILSSWISTPPTLIATGVAGSNVGYSVAIQSGVALVGAPSFNDGTRVQGMAGVYVAGGGNDWSNATETLLLPVNFPSTPASLKNNNDTHFGEAVAISTGGLKLAIGAPGYEINESFPDSGAVFVVTLDSNKVGTSFEPVIPDPSLDSATLTNAQFGVTVDISATTLASGNNYYNNEQGSVWVAKINGTQWNNPAIPLPSLNAVADQQAGASIAVVGDYIAVGSTENGNSLGGCGKVNLHNYRNGNWVESPTSLKNPACDETATPNPGASDYFGYSLNMNPNFLIIGAPNATDDLPGSAQQGSTFIIPTATF